MNFHSIANYGYFYHNPSQPVCPRCGSTSFGIGAGLKPRQESLRCLDCKAFIGYSPIPKLKALRRKKLLTESLDFLEQQGFQGDSAILILSLVGGEE